MSSTVNVRQQLIRSSLRQKSEGKKRGKEEGSRQTATQLKCFQLPTLVSLELEDIMHPYKQQQQPRDEEVVSNLQVFTTTDFSEPVPVSDLKEWITGSPHFVPLSSSSSGSSLSSIPLDDPFILTSKNNFSPRPPPTCVRSFRGQHRHTSAVEAVGPSDDLLLNAQVQGTTTIIITKKIKKKRRIKIKRFPMPSPSTDLVTETTSKRISNLQNECIPKSILQVINEKKEKKWPGNLVGKSMQQHRILLK